MSSVELIPSCKLTDKIRRKVRKLTTLSSCASQDRYFKKFLARLEKEYADSRLCQQTSSYCMCCTSAADENSSSSSSGSSEYSSSQSSSLSSTTTRLSRLCRRPTGGNDVKYSSNYFPCDKGWILYFIIYISKGGCTLIEVENSCSLLLRN